MIKGKLNIRGETLAETIVALSILAIGITISSTVIMNSIRNLTNAKNRVIAVNIAREGIEAVRSIRDTNWLLYSDKRRQCWNHGPDMGVCTDSLGPILPGVYVVYKKNDSSWQLFAADKDVGADIVELDGGDADTIKDNDIDPERIKLSLVDIDLGIDSDGLDPDEDLDGGNDDLDMYNHVNADITDPLGTEIKSAIFSRYIVIEYLENQPGADSAVDLPDDSINTLNEWDNIVTSGGDTDTLNRMRVTSVVSWFNKGVPSSLELKTIITDHLGREDLDS